jgi:hypothetical protein
MKYTREAVLQKINYYSGKIFCFPTGEENTGKGQKDDDFLKRFLESMWVNNRTQNKIK